MLITVAGLEPKLNIQCGPLLRFVYTDLLSNSGPPISLYTLLIVTKDLGSDYSASPFLSIAGIYADDKEDPSFIASEKIHQERGFAFWRWKIYLTLTEEERRIKYAINGSKEDIAFYIPSSRNSMRLVFHTCNGPIPPYPSWNPFSRRFMNLTFRLQSGRWSHPFQRPRSPMARRPPPSSFHQTISRNARRWRPNILRWNGEEVTKISGMVTN